MSTVRLEAQRESLSWRGISTPSCDADRGRHDQPDQREALGAAHGVDGQRVGEEADVHGARGGEFMVAKTAARQRGVRG